MSSDVTVRRFEDLAEPLPEVRISWPLIVLAWITTGIGLLTSAALAHYPKEARLHHDIGSAALAIEVPHSRADIHAVLRPSRVETGPLRRGDNEMWEEHVRGMLRNQLRWDALFIPFYVGFFFLLARLLGAHGQRGHLVYVALGVMLVADYLENWNILRLIDTPFDKITDQMAHAIKLCALIKWGAFTLVLFGLARMLSYVILRPLDRTLTGILSMLLFLAGVFGATGLSPEWRPWLL
ncbi:MAG TPA: hypothetical protein VEQ63_00405, partial [Bryobacteraceae bacterium]|nr:hypothetical protein [Bryobacteraceae bacterium]